MSDTVPGTAAAPDFVPFDAEAGLVFATRLPGERENFGAGRTSLAMLLWPDDPPPLWVNLDRTKDAAKAWIRGPAGLDPLVAEALLAEETRPRTQSIGEGLLIILRGVNQNPGAEPDDLIAIRMWLEPTRIITLRQFRFATIAAIRERAQRGEAPSDPGAFLTEVVSGLTVRLDPCVAALEDRLDDIEEAMVLGNEDQPGWRAELADIRRQAIALRRFLVDERDLQRLRLDHEHAARVVDALEEIRDRSAVTQDELRARHEARLSRTLYLLTIVATVALPLGLLTGLLGINVGGLPLANSAHGFLIVTGLMVLLAIAEIAIFRWMRWL